MKVIVEADGGARGNPGPAGYGAVVLDGVTGAVLAERGEALGIATNNVAEYQGLIAGLRAAADLGATAVDVRMDSKLVVEQMTGRWQIKNPGLRPLAAQAARLVREFDTVSFGWIPREKNKRADALANQAMDRAAGKPAKSSRAASAVAAAPGAAAPGAAAPGAAAPGAAAPGAAAPGAASASGEAPAATAASDPTVTTAGPPAAEPQPSMFAVAGSGAVPAASWEPPATATATRLILVRHGETGMNKQSRYSGRGDVPLSEQGVAQAVAAAARIAVIRAKVDAIVCSPLVRCVDTARAIAAEVGHPTVRTEADLIECDFGDWEGRTFAEVRERWPAELTSWLASTELAPPGGESFAQVAGRVRRVVRELLGAYRGKTVVVVSHVSPLKIILRDALGAGDALLHRLYLDPTGISVIDTWPDGGVAVRTVNDTAHLAGIATP
ncbi:bifunctional RNase H/acid phosphatase [Solwaraspora sp. WMMD406]|uniref:bifunctional RNase H/acid phosphatase n=1 Tax=Solwaraspora sp. WMMD406 TaxID=3016095 RepID=UPI002416F515|nr:bifunctional RNase H/acid phosphatase [Solwaraspora sp. WMMD406]MDG4765050.1 bifunctional RNase H/acid phosphatase [Solwaraspora sp. WMMD406]